MYVCVYVYVRMCACGCVYTCTVDVPVEGAYLCALHNNALNSRSPTDRVGIYIIHTIIYVLRCVVFICGSSAPGVASRLCEPLQYII